MRPRRAAGVELSEVTDGFLVYQPDRDRVHYLNPTAPRLSPARRRWTKSSSQPP
jgi:hypothetical protein